VVALSYEVLPQGRPWQQAEGLLTPEIKATIKAALSAMWAFHAWIIDCDHNWNGGNVIVELHATEPARLAFIDYSDEGAIEELIVGIEKLSLTDFDRVIRRIPGDCLANGLVDPLIAGLDARRANLRNILKH
jgi:hypothetical protein